jgi:quercetin dioxygenase-like cupin family protein
LTSPLRSEPMNRYRYAATLLLAVGCCATAPGWAQTDGHKMVKAADLKWEAIPSLPKGATAVVIEGPMSEAVPFTIRIKMPANYKIPPHWHPAVERVTVLSGTFNMGVGDKFDQTKSMAVGPGDMMILQPKTNHFAWTDKDTVVQLNGNGPWAITYVNPDDDPRKK